MPKLHRLPPLEVSPEALAVLTAYSWPGNVRELENVIEGAVAMTSGAILTPDDLPERIRSGNQAMPLLEKARSRQMTLRELEHLYIADTLRRGGGNKSRVAEMLGSTEKPFIERSKSAAKPDS